MVYFWCMIAGMLYLLLMLLPLALASGSLIARDQLRPGVVAGVFMVLLQLVVVGWAPSPPPAAWLGTTLLLQPFNEILLGSWLLMVAGVLAALLLGTAEHRDPSVVLCMVGALAAALLVQQPSTIVLLVLVVMLSGSMLLAGGAGERVATRSPVVLGLRYVLAAVIGGVAIVAAHALAGMEALPTGIPAGLLLAGLGVWVVVLPMLLALTPVAEQMSLPSFMLLVGALPPVAGLLIGTTQFGPTATIAAVPLFAIIVLTCTMAVPLLAPPSPRRIMALLLLANSGQLMVGPLLGSDYGLRAALLGSVAHALALSLVLPGVMLLERVGGGSGRREPVTMAALLLGLLLLIGLPPFPGWYAKVELWYAASEQTVLVQWLLGAGQALLVAGAARLALLRPESRPVGRSTDRHIGGRAGLLSRVWLLLLIGGVLVSGFASGPLIDRVGAAMAGRTPSSAVAR